MNKKSQFYAFAAIVLIAGFLAVVTNKSTISFEKVDNIAALKQNYVHESNIIINNAVYQNKNISTQLRQFTEEFIEYAKNKNINLGIIFLYSQHDKVYIVNYLKEPVLIKSVGKLHPKKELYVEFAYKIQLDYMNETFTFYFKNQDVIEFNTLLLKE